MAKNLITGDTVKSETLCFGKIAELNNSFLRNLSDTEAMKWPDFDNRG